MSEKECDDYAVTWLSKQRVMLLKDSLTLKLNFPTLLPVMYKILACILNNAPNIEEIRKKEDAVNGFLFEAEFFFTALQIIQTSLLLVLLLQIAMHLVA